MSQDSQKLAELSYKKRTVLNSRQDAGIRSDGLPYTGRAKVSVEKRAKRELCRRIEDLALAKELGISLKELREGTV